MRPIGAPLRSSCWQRADCHLGLHRESTQAFREKRGNLLASSVSPSPMSFLKNLGAKSLEQTESHPINQQTKVRPQSVAGDNQPLVALAFTCVLFFCFGQAE